MHRDTSIDSSHYPISCQRIIFYCVQTLLKLSPIPIKILKGSEWKILRASLPYNAGYKHCGVGGRGKEKEILCAHSLKTNPGCP